ncbi:MAG: PAS domain S-box protein, partial [Cyanobacteria bacterium P01_F01_bin.153]
MGRSLLSLVHPEDLTANQAAFERCLDRGHKRAQRVQGRWQRSDGSFCWLEWNFVGVSTGEATEFYGVARNITDPKQQVAIAQKVEQKLTEELALYSGLVKELPMAINLWQLQDLDNVESLLLISSNKAAQDNVGLGKVSVVGKTILECFPDVPADELRRLGRVARQELSNYFYQAIYVYPGDPLPRSYDVCLFSLPQNCVAVIFEDISDRVHLSQQLRRSEGIFRAIFERAPLGIARMSPEGYWLQINNRLCEILGYSPSELQQKNFQEITHPGDAAQDEVFYSQLLSGAINTCVLEKRYLHAQGHFVWSNVSVSALRKDSGELDCFVVTVQDISGRKAMESAAQQQSEKLHILNTRLARTAQTLDRRNEELQQFAYVVSHDLKAPLRAISSLSEWLEDDLQGVLPEDSREHLQLIRKRIERMGNLLNGLLEYSRVGRKQIEPGTVVIAELLQGVIDSLSPPSGFEVEIVGQMPVLQARSLSLQQVFANLIGNAIKYCDRNDGKLIILVEERDKDYAFSLEDNGPGIDSHHHEKIFTIFQTLNSRDKVESTGVGLAIVKKILELEGGTISVASELGQGTTFTFTWPKV